MIINIKSLVKDVDMYEVEVINDSSGAIMIHDHIYGGKNED